MQFHNKFYQSSILPIFMYLVKRFFCDFYCFFVFFWWSVADVASVSIWAFCVQSSSISISKWLSIKVCMLVHSLSARFQVEFYAGHDASAMSFSTSRLNPLHTAWAPNFAISVLTSTPTCFSSLGCPLMLSRYLAQGHPEAGCRNATQRRTTNENSTAIFILSLVVMLLLDRWCCFTV